MGPGGSRKDNRTLAKILMQKLTHMSRGVPLLAPDCGLITVEKLGVAEDSPLFRALGFKEFDVTNPAIFPRYRRRKQGEKAVQLSLEFQT